MLALREATSAPTADRYGPAPAMPTSSSRATAPPVPLNWRLPHLIRRKLSELLAPFRLEVEVDYSSRGRAVRSGLVLSLFETPHSFVLLSAFQRPPSIESARVARPIGMSTMGDLRGRLVPLWLLLWKNYRYRYCITIECLHPVSFPLDLDSPQRPPTPDARSPPPSHAYTGSKDTGRCRPR